jgi:hypothetical protein
MKKKILSGIFALALLIATGYGVSKSVKSEANLSDLALTNVEALASGENGTPCGGPKTFGECESRNQVNCKDMSGCQ